MPRCFVALTMFLRLSCFGGCTGISFVDSTCIPVIHNKRQYGMKVSKGFAVKGKSTMGWYVGFKLHLLCNEKGEIVNFVLTRANVDDRNDAVIDTLTDRVFGKLYADKGYISQSLFGRLWSEGIHVVTGLRSNMRQRLMPLYDKIMLRKRSIIETVNDMLKNVAQLVHTRHRSLHNFLMDLLAAMGRTASSSPSQQSTSTTRCRTQTVSSPFANSPNPIFSKAYQATTSMVARHYVFIRIAPFQSTLIPNSRYKVLEHRHRVVARAPHALRVHVHELPVDERVVDVIMKPPKEMVGRNENVIQSRVLAQNEFLPLCNHTSKLLKTNGLHK